MLVDDLQYVPVCLSQRLSYQLGWGMQNCVIYFLITVYARCPCLFSHFLVLVLHSIDYGPPLLPLPLDSGCRNHLLNLSDHKDYGLPLLPQLQNQDNSLWLLNQYHNLYQMYHLYYHRLVQIILFQAEHWGVTLDRKSTRLNSSHVKRSRMPSSAWKKKKKQTTSHNRTTLLY